jgi:hypothetical protein
MVLKQILQPKREEVMGDWRKSRAEGIRDLFSLNTTGDDQVKQSVVGGTCSTNKREEKCSQGFDGEKLEEKIFERRRHRWKDDIKVHLKEI